MGLFDCGFVCGVDGREKIGDGSGREGKKKVEGRWENGRRRGNKRRTWYCVKGQVVRVEDDWCCA